MVSRFEIKFKNFLNSVEGLRSYNNDDQGTGVENHKILS